MLTDEEGTPWRCIARSTDEGGCAAGASAWTSWENSAASAVMSNKRRSISTRNQAAGASVAARIAETLRRFASMREDLMVHTAYVSVGADRQRLSAEHPCGDCGTHF